jgi:hypothetical protein
MRGSSMTSIAIGVFVISGCSKAGNEATAKIAAASAPSEKITTAELMTIDMPKSISSEERTSIPYIPVPTDKQPAVFGAAISPSRAAPGSEVTLTVTAIMAPGWHIYAVGNSNGVNTPTAFKLALPDGISPQREWDAPTPEVLPNELGTSSVYHKQAVFSRRLHLSDKMAAGLATISCQVSYQACDHNRCMPPDETTVSTDLKVMPLQGK